MREAGDPSPEFGEHVEQGLAGNRVLDKVAAARRFSGLIVAGIARPVRQSAPKAAFSITSYSRKRRQLGMALGPSPPVSRLLRLTSAFLP
jgi:hypothetical protein